MDKRIIGLKQYQPRVSVTLEDYEQYIGQERVRETKQLAEPLQGRGWMNVNSTFVGGGVAEMLRSVVPLARSLGVKASWRVIEGNDGVRRELPDFRRDHLAYNDIVHAMRVGNPLLPASPPHADLTL